MHAARTGRCRVLKAKQSNVKARAQGKEAHPCAFCCFVLHEALRQVQVLHLQPRQPRLRLILVLCSEEGRAASERKRNTAKAATAGHAPRGGPPARRSRPLRRPFPAPAAAKTQRKGSSAHSAQCREKRRCASQRGAARTAAASSAPRARAAARSARVAASSAVSRATSASRAAAASRAASAAWLASAHAWGWGNVQRSSARGKRERRREKSTAGVRPLAPCKTARALFAAALASAAAPAPRRRASPSPPSAAAPTSASALQVSAPRYKSFACKLRASRSALSVASSAPASAARRVASRAAAVAAACAAKTPRKGSTSRALRAHTAARSADTTAASSMPAAAGRTARRGWPADVAREVRTGAHAGGAGCPSSDVSLRPLLRSPRGVECVAAADARAAVETPVCKRPPLILCGLRRCA